MKVTAPRPKCDAVAGIHLIVAAGKGSGGRDQIGAVILVQQAAGKAAATVGNEMADDGIRRPSGVQSVEIEDVIAADTGGVKRIDVLQNKSAAGGGVEIGLHDQSLGGRKHGDAEEQRTSLVRQTERTATVGLN